MSTHNNINRRDFLRSTGVGAAALFAGAETLWPASAMADSSFVSDVDKGWKDTVLVGQLTLS